MKYDVVIPTVGRPSLATCLRALAAQSGPPPELVTVVDDRPPGTLAPLSIPRGLSLAVRTVKTHGTGPAAARNAGWRAGAAPWVVFVDDDVTVGPTWRAQLVVDLAVGSDVAGVTGRIRVPLPTDRRPTDWERNTAGLAGARWITADIAYRRAALTEVGGFDERFRRAFREDSDLAVRMIREGWSIGTGRRASTHPVRPADPWISVRREAGNEDDALMRALHGPGWWRLIDAAVGRRRRHLAITGFGALAIAAAATGHRRVAAAAAAGWLLGVGEFAAVRIQPGPRTAGEISTMLATSAAIPPMATYYWLRGLVRYRNAAPWTAAGSRNSRPGPAHACQGDLRETGTAVRRLRA